MILYEIGYKLKNNRKINDLTKIKLIKILLINLFFIILFLKVSFLVRKKNY